MRGQSPMGLCCLGVLLLLGGLVARILLYHTYTTDTGCLGWPRCRLFDNRGLHWGCLGISTTPGANRTAHCRGMKGIFGILGKMIRSAATSAVGIVTVLGVHRAMTPGTDSGPQLQGAFLEYPTFEVNKTTSLLDFQLDRSSSMLLIGGGAFLLAILTAVCCS